MSLFSIRKMMRGGLTSLKRRHFVSKRSSKLKFFYPCLPLIQHINQGSVFSKDILSANPTFTISPTIIARFVRLMFTTWPSCENKSRWGLNISWCFPNLCHQKNWRVFLLNEMCSETDQSETSIYETPPTPK